MELENILELAQLKKTNKQMIDIMGITPEDFEEIVQRGYVTCLIKGDLRGLKDLNNITKIKPALDEDFVQSVYANRIKEGGGDLRELKDLEKITRIKPAIAENVVQEGYAYCITRDWLGQLDCLYGSFGIKPVVPEHLVQIMYAKYVSEERLSYLEMLQRITGIKPVIEENIVQKAYLTCLKKGDLKQLEKLKEITGRKIVMTDEIVQEISRVPDNKRREEEMHRARVCRALGD